METMHTDVRVKRLKRSFFRVSKGIRVCTDVNSLLFGDHMVFQGEQWGIGRRQQNVNEGL